MAWTKISKPTGNGWTEVPKPTGQIQNFFSGGEPMGLLLALTYSTVTSSVVSAWTDVIKPTTPNWTEVPKPTT